MFKRLKFLGMLVWCCRLGAAPILQQSYDQAVSSKRQWDFTQIFNNFTEDLVDLNKSVFGSVETLRALTWVLPVYLLMRSVDDDIHSCFYLDSLHQNISQMPDFPRMVADKGVPMLSLLFMLMPLSHRVDPDLQDTSRLFISGVASVSAMRTLIKYSLKTRSSLRPWNGHFSKCNRALGGFPSGHMAMATYMAVTYGLRHGAGWGLPLGAFAGFVFMASLNSNRHYASQLAGGFGLGLIYGLASNRVLESRYGDNVQIGLDQDSAGRPTLSLSCQF